MIQHYIPLTKKIDLRILSDKRYFFKLLRTIPEFNLQIMRIKNIISLFEKHLSDEWLIFHPYPFDGVALKIENKKTISLNFVDDLIPLGLSLLDLRKLKGFNKIIDKLNMRAHDRLSAVLEATFSAKYKNKGYSVCLEPATNINKCPDFKVKHNNEWIFFECKAENYFESESFNRNNKNFSKLSERLKEGLAEFKNLSIDLKSKRKPTNKDLAVLQTNIKDNISKGNFGNTIDSYGIKFTINQVPSNTITDIQISQFVYSGTSMDKRRLGKLLNSAKTQIPPNREGVIIIKARDRDIAVSIAKERIRRSGYRHISAIVIIESGEGEIVFNKDSKIHPRDFVRISLSQPLPNYWW